MALKIDINVDLSNLSEESLKQAIQNRANSILKTEYNKTSKKLQDSINASLKAKNTNISGANSDGGKYSPNRYKRSGSPFPANKVPWGKFWYAETKDTSFQKARVYIGCGDGSKVIEIDYDFLFDYEKLEDLAEDIIQDGINTSVPTWVGGANQLLKNTDLPPGTYLPPVARFAAGNSSEGYIYCRNGNQWIYMPAFSGLSLLNSGPFWLGQHLIYDLIRYNLKLEHIVLPYRQDIAVVIVYGSNVIQQRKIDFIRSIYAGGNKANISIKSVIMHSPFRYSITQNPVTHEYIVGRKSSSFSISQIVARMAPYPNGTLSEFDENQTIRFQIMAGPDVGQYYANGAIPPESIDKTPEWYDNCYAITPVLTVTTVPVNPAGDPPDNHGYDLSDNYSFTIVNGGTTAPRLYRSLPLVYGDEPGETFTQPNDGDYIFIRIHSVKNGTGQKIYPIQDQTGYNYDRNFHQVLFVDFYTTDTGTVGPADTSASSFQDKADLISHRFQQDVHVDSSTEPLIKCFLVSEKAIKEISTPSSIATSVIPKVIGTLTQTNETVDGIGEKIQETMIAAQVSTDLLNWASCSDALDTDDFGPLVECSGLNSKPVNKLGFSENFGTSIYPYWTKGYNSAISDNVSVIQNDTAPPIDGYKNADRLKMKPKTVNTYYETGSLFNNNLIGSLYNFEIDKPYLFSWYAKWAGTGYVSESYAGEEIDNSDSAILDRTFVTVQHINDNGLVVENCLSPIGFDWRRYSFVFSYTGKNDKIRFVNWNKTEHVELDLHIWGAQIEDFKTQDQSETGEEGPSEYQPRGGFTQVYYAGLYPDYYGRKSGYPYPGMKIDKIPKYEYIKPDFTDSNGGVYKYTDFPISLGVSGQQYNWIDSATWYNFEPQAGDYLSPMQAPFGKWSPVIYDVIFGTSYYGDGTGTSRAEYGAPNSFNVGAKSSERDADGVLNKTKLNYNPDDYEVMPSYKEIIDSLVNGVAPPATESNPMPEKKKGQKLAKLRTTNDESIYGIFKTKRTNAIRVDTVKDFEEINKRSTRNRYNWSLDSQQMRMCQFTDFGKSKDNHDKLISLGFTENDLKF